ncbi:taurine ABC transporter ATP-binding subunit [Chitinimonas koreensis]|uniref:taurine ABC transporter ATP-binding subunit n=1 Tax=Chitinimonas koreensis TaxID=356302 RepID=UPI0003F69C39|nr:taurine ABC transporter ATP-binding subunit [Chitinimonas koreensis]QNM95764.1 taurine ABC transporter ATP-binding subunit [Chitinimonas koreensis]
MSALRLESVTVGYGEPRRPVLDAVSLEVRDGELVVALGPSGCGKTTLLNLMAGFIRPDRGRVTLDGEPVAGPGAERGVVFQDDALLPWLDVLGNVGFGLALRGVPRDEREARARETLKLVDLTGFERQRTWQLSGGQRQRVGLARALTADPRVLLLDEPFGALDALNREQMQALLLRVWRATGKRVFLITHDIEEAVFLATELILLGSRPGRVLDRLTLDFGRRHAAGEPVRSIKSDPAFIAVREAVLARVLTPAELSA